MATSLARNRALVGNSRDQRTTGPRPLLIDAEPAMNAVAHIDDLVEQALDLAHELASIRRSLVAGFARYERPSKA